MQNIEKVKEKYVVEEIQRQKNVANSLLYRLSDTFNQTAYLAGGMLRDHFFKKVGSDFDIYMEYQEGFDYETFMVSMLEGIEGLHDFKRMGTITQHSYGYTGTGIHSIYEGKISSFNEDYPVQVIVLSVPARQYIEEFFCCSLSKVWQTCHYEPLYTHDFLMSVLDNRMYFDFSNCHKVNTSYIQKMCNKFPDMEVDRLTESHIRAYHGRKAYWQ